MLLMLMKKITIVFIFIAVITITGCAPTREATIKQILSLDTQHFKDTITIKDDASDTVAEFSTLNGYRQKKFLGIDWLDSFLRGFINKKTGKRSYQVYQFISYQGRGWRFYNRVDYETPEGPRSKALTRFHEEVMNCSSSIDCTYEEHVVFDVEEALLREIAERSPEIQGKLNAQGKIIAWSYKLYSKAGHELEYGLPPAEVAGLLERMDEYAKKHALGS